MKNKSTKKIDYFTIFLSILFFLNFVVNLSFFIIEGKTYELSILFLYGTGFLFTIGFLLFGIFAYKKLFAVAINKIYYAYSQNIVSESKLIEKKVLKFGKLKKVSSDSIIEYRKIDNFYVTQKIGLISLDENKDLIVFYKSEFRNDFSKSLFKGGLDNYESNKDVFFVKERIQDLDCDNVFYSDDKLKAVSIKEQDGFIIEEYDYSFNSPESKLSVALNKCIPHWELKEKEHEEVYQTFEEAETVALKIIEDYCQLDILNNE